MKEYRVTIYHSMIKKKRRINVRGHKMRDAIKYTENNLMNRVTDEIVKVERWDERK
jgi:hypothetical protein